MSPIKLIDRTHSVRKMVAAITISKVGVLRLNKKAAQLLGIANGDRVSLFQDENRPQDWYISKTDSGLICRNAYGKDREAKVANNARLAAELHEQFAPSEKSVTIQMAQEPIDVGYYALITAKLVAKKIGL